MVLIYLHINSMDELEHLFDIRNRLTLELANVNANIHRIRHQIKPECPHVELIDRFPVCKLCYSYVSRSPRDITS